MSIFALGLVSCETPMEQVPPRVPQEQLFWSLTLNHRAVTLSTTAPYDTITLVATAKNVDGVPLPNQPKTQFVPTGDLLVTVDTNGVVRARGTTGTAGIRVIARMTYNGITRADTAYVKATSTPSPKPIHTIALDVLAGDSTVIANSGGLIDLRSKRVRVSAYDDVGDPINGAIAYYWTNSTAAITDRQTGSTTLLGIPGVSSVVIHVAATVYGKSQSDSLVLTVTEPLLGTVRVTKPNHSQNTTIIRGGDIVWINMMSDSLDIVFDEPNAAHIPVGASTFGFVARDSAGNIGLFSGDPTFNLGHANLAAIRSRNFPNPGEYHYRSVRHPNVTGVIRVK